MPLSFIQLYKYSIEFIMAAVAVNGATLAARRLCSATAATRATSTSALLTRLLLLQRLVVPRAAARPSASARFFTADAHHAADGAGGASGTPPPSRPELSALGRLARLLAVTLVGGSILAAASEVERELHDISPETRKRDLDRMVAAGEAVMVPFTRGNGQAVTLVVMDRVRRAGGRTVLLAVDSVSLLADVADELADAGVRTIVYEEVVPVHGVLAGPARDAATVVDDAARAMAAVLTACEVDTPVVVVTGALEWMGALLFAARNAAAGSIAGLVLVDPILPPLPADSDASVSQAHARIAAAASAAASAPRELPTTDAADMERQHALRLHTIDPLHRLEHLLVGPAHQHTYCGAASALATRRAASASPAHLSAPAPTAADGSSVPAVRWRDGLPGGAAATSTTAAAPRPVAIDEDMVDTAALALERLYRDRLATVHYRPTLIHMIPTFAQSVAPSLARFFSYEQLRTLDAKVAALADGCRDANATAGWVATLAEVAGVLPVEVRTTGLPPGPEAREEARWNPWDAALSKPLEVEVVMRRHLQDDAAARHATWAALLPGAAIRCAAAAAATNRDVFDVDARSLAATAASLATTSAAQARRHTAADTHLY